MRYTKTVCSSILASAMALSAAPALAADEPDRSLGQDRAVSPSQSREIQEALRRDLDLTATQARRHEALQAKALKVDQQLQRTLGGAHAGSLYDARTGKLTVMVSDAEQLDEARAAGARARLVAHSKAELQAIKADLDAATGQKRDASPADRQATTQQAPLVPGMTSWSIDTESNTVRVTVKRDQAQAAEDALATYGDAVEVVPSDLAPSATAAFMDGGDGINGNSCSAGFNLRNRTTGVGYLLTAGHCVSRGSTLYGQGWVPFGPVLESWFPTYDDALARNDNPGYWIQGPWVDYNPSSGGVISVSSYTDAPVNTVVCKTGVTTKWTCGRITGKDESVVYDGKYTVHGLTRHSACVEKGDSGGSVVSVTNVYAAEGVNSGASMIWDGSRYRCRAAYGLQNVSWYFPIADSLAHYGPKYGVTLW